MNFLCEGGAYRCLPESILLSFSPRQQTFGSGEKNIVTSDYPRQNWKSFMRDIAREFISLNGNISL